MNIAIISRSNKSYSETFIRAHREKLDGNIFYYYNAYFPYSLEGKGVLKLNFFEKIIETLKRKFSLTSFSNHQQAVLNSFKKNKIDVVLAEYGETAHHIMSICEKLKIPVIAHFHGYDASVKNILYKYNYYNEVFKKCKYVIVVSKKMFDDFIKFGCPEDKLIYNVYGPDEEFLKIIPFYAKKQFISIGRFVDKKAPYYLILAFKEIIKKYPEVCLVMAGDGYLFNSCHNLIKVFQLNNNIKLVGVIGPEEYRGYLKESLAFVQHSVVALNGDSEGTPVAMLEASAAGLPIISTEHAGIIDVIENHKNGLLSAEHDIENMINNILYVIENPKESIIMGKRGKEIIKEKFSLENHIANLNQIIKNCKN